METKKRKETVIISHKECIKAVREYLNEGGTITQLTVKKKKEKEIPNFGGISRAVSEFLGHGSTRVQRNYPEGYNPYNL